MEEKISYEVAIRELETIVRTLEEGKQPLDEALRLFARGVELAAFCQEQLRVAKGRVRELTSTLEGMSLLPIEEED